MVLCDGSVVVGAEVNLFLAGNKVAGPVKTDSDGYFMIPFKAIGKATTYQVVATFGAKTRSMDVILKANGFGYVEFTQLCD